MNTSLAVATLLIAQFCFALGKNIESQDTAEDGKTFFVVDVGTTTSNGLFNSTTLLALAAGAVTLVIALGAIALLLGLLAGGTSRDGYNNRVYEYPQAQAYEGRTSWSYGDYQGWWDSLTILEWIALARELYEKFDPNELDCHKRMLCEIHEVGTLSKAATAVDYAADYARYLEAFNLPENIRELLDEYMDAVDKGRTPVPTKPCGQLFSACQFSLSDVFNRAYGSNDL